MGDKRHLSSLKRGLEALSILNLEGRLTAAELSKKIKVPRTTAHRILDTLVAEGYVIHDPHSHCFHLSGQVRRLAFGFNRDGLTAEVARPILRRLCQELLTPVGLTTPVGQAMVMQVSMDYESPLALQRLPEGTRFPVTYGPSGHLFLAHCSDAVRHEMVEAAKTAPEASMPHKPPTDAEIEQIRKDHYAVTVNPGREEGVLAVPVYSRGQFVASIHMRYMRRVQSQTAVIERYLAKMRAAALEIEEQLEVTMSRTPELYAGVNGPLLVSQPPIQTTH